MLFETGMEVTLEDGVVKAKTTVCGWKEGKYFLVEAIAALKTRINSQFVARIYDSGCYSGFSTSILGLFPEINLMAFRYPDDVEGSNSRKAGRYHVMMPVTIARSHDGPVLDEGGVVTDLSAGGLRFSCLMKFSLGEAAYLDGLLPAERYRGVAVTVRSCVDTGSKYDYGAEFAPADGEARDSLAGYLAALSHLPPYESWQEPKKKDKHPIAPVNGQMNIQVGIISASSIFRGVSRTHILIDAPQEKGNTLMVNRIVPATIKYVDSGRAYKLQCMVFKQYTNPARIWALSRPPETPSVSMRKSARAPVFVPAVLNADGARIEGALINLSDGGGLFATSDPEYDEASISRLNITLPTGMRVEGTLCKSKNVQRIGGKILIGLAFADEDKKKRLAFKAYYEACARYLS
jgi:hypothetical protein